MYRKRKAYLEGMLAAESAKLSSQARFIMEIIERKLVISKAVFLNSLRCAYFLEYLCVSCLTCDMGIFAFMHCAYSMCVYSSRMLVEQDTKHKSIKKSLTFLSFVYRKKLGLYRKSLYIDVYVNSMVFE